MEILGVRIDNLTKQEISAKIDSCLESDSFSQIATINPEFILTAQKDREFRSILNAAQLCLADGTGIKFAFWRYKKKLKRRTTGADLVYDILEFAAKKGQSVFIVSGRNSLSTWREVRKAILYKYPNLRIKGMNLDKNSKKIPIIDESFQILFCTYGAPQQDKFIYSLKKQNNSRIRLAIGVGGSFDFMTGKIKRAPKMLQNFGLEWLWRFFQEPRYRAKRVFNAAVVFPIKILFSKK